MSSLSKKALSLMIGLLKMDPAERLTGEQALQHPWFDDIRDPNDDAQLLNMIATIQRPIYSSQSRITSYGQKFNNAPPPQNQLMQQNS
jgi:serine/threonine protein kinase